MNEIDIRATIAAWPRWRKVTLSIALLVLIGYSVWFTLFINNPIAILQP